jgi:protein-tyrosine-phosphatase
VLFLCTGNSARSPMAEALLNLQARGSVVARSAGSQPRPVHRGAVRAMAAHGVDLGGHRPKHLDRFVQQRFDRVVTLCDRVREVCPEFVGHPKMAHWSMADPSAEPAAEGARDPFVRAAAEIEARVALLLAELLVPARPA